MLGFLGPNGAGNSTTIRLAVGLTHPTASSVAPWGWTGCAMVSRRALLWQEAAALAMLAAPVPLVTLFAALLGRRFELSLAAGPLLGVTAGTVCCSTSTWAFSPCRWAD